jgi:hypothetical protein
VIKMPHIFWRLTRDFIIQFRIRVLKKLDRMSGAVLLLAMENESRTRWEKKNKVASR